MVRDDSFETFVQTLVYSVVKSHAPDGKGRGGFHRGHEGKMLKGKLARGIILKKVRGAIGFTRLLR